MIHKPQALINVKRNTYLALVFCFIMPKLHTAPLGSPPADDITEIPQTASFAPTKIID